MQVLKHILLSVFLQVLEEISCYSEKYEAKELRRILTQPHFMVSRVKKHKLNKKKQSLYGSLTSTVFITKSET